MAQVAINRCSDLESAPRLVLEQTRAIKQAIQQRAFDLYRSHPDDHNCAAEDWLRAEREVVWVPTAELIETDKEWRARIAVPGFAAKDLQVSATPKSLIVQASDGHSRAQAKGNVSFCEFSSKRLFRQINLPSPIDFNKVSASLDRGILAVIAPKAAVKLKSAAAHG